MLENEMIFTQQREKNINCKIQIIVYFDYSEVKTPK